MISVKDREISLKRQAFRETINLHKKYANTHANAIFSSTTDRFGRAQSIDVPGGRPNDRDLLQDTSRSNGFDIQASEIALKDGSQNKLAFQQDNP